MRFQQWRYAIALSSVTLLTACGGGSGSSDDSSGPDNGDAAGIYEGTTGDNRELLGALLPNGDYYVIYTGGPANDQIGGFVRGSGTPSNGSFTSTDGTDFNFEGSGQSPVTVSASYRTRNSLSGTISGAGGSNTFTSTYSAEYEKTPSLQAIARTYVGVVQDAAGDTVANVTVATNGTITGTTATGCNVSGDVEPARRGNTYDLNLAISGASCAANGLALIGVVLHDTTDNSIVAAASDASNSYGLVFLGIE